MKRNRGEQFKNLQNVFFYYTNVGCTPQLNAPYKPMQIYDFNQLITYTNKYMFLNLTSECEKSTSLLSIDKQFFGGRQYGKWPIRRLKRAPSI